VVSARTGDACVMDTAKLAAAMVMNRDFRSILVLPQFKVVYFDFRQ
jgi:hypothetical protein